MLTNKLVDQKANKDRLSNQLKQGKKMGVQEQELDTDSSQKLHFINNKLEKKIEHTYTGVFKLSEKKDTLEMLSKIEHLIQRLQENFKKYEAAIPEVFKEKLTSCNTRMMQNNREKFKQENERIALERSDKARKKAELPPPKKRTTRNLLERTKPIDKVVKTTVQVVKKE